MRNLDNSNVSINRLTFNAISAFKNELNSRMISVETDLAPLEAQVNVSLVSKAVVALIENAIESMPSGGRMTVTLIKSSHQWELEIADTSGVGRKWLDLETPADPTVNDSKLPSVIPIENNEYLSAARKAAQMQGGDVQSWDCPQGGTAHVLVIPNKRTARNAA